MKHLMMRVSVVFVCILTFALVSNVLAFSAQATVVSGSYVDWVLSDGTYSVQPFTDSLAVNGVMVGTHVDPEDSSSFRGNDPYGAIKVTSGQFPDVTISVDFGDLIVRPPEVPTTMPTLTPSPTPRGKPVHDPEHPGLHHCTWEEDPLSALLGGLCE
jgi:hypothetical protein